MAQSHNPNTPNTLGLEWMGGSSGVDILDSDSAALGIYVPSTISETITGGLIMPAVTPNFLSGDAAIAWVDIYRADEPVLAPIINADTPIRVTYDPNEDKARSGAVTDSGATTNLYQAIDDGSSDNDADYIVNGAASSTYRMQFNSAAFGSGIVNDTAPIVPFPGYKRVLAVWFEVRCAGASVQGAPPYVDLELWYASTKYSTIARLNAGFAGPTVFKTYILGPFYINHPATRPWFATDIAQFDNNVAQALGLSWNPSTGQTVRISKIRMHVDYVTETRLFVAGGTGILTRSTTPNDINFTGTQSGTFQKSIANYLYVLRRLEYNPANRIAQLQIPWIDSGRIPPFKIGQAYKVSILPDGRVTDVNPLAYTKSYSISWGIFSGSTVSSDSQQYYESLRVPINNLSLQRANQRITTPNPVAASYKYVRFVAGIMGTVTKPLLIRVRKASDNSLVTNGSIDFPVSYLTDPPSTVAVTKLGVADGVTFFECLVPFATALVLATSTQYYVEFTSEASGAVAADGTQDSWSVPKMHHTITNLTYTTNANKSFGGGTDYATIGTTAGTNDWDLPVSLQFAPTQPLTVSVTERHAAITDTGSLDDLGTLNYCRVSWVTGAPPPTFAAYVIERSDDNVTWQEIGRVTASAVKDFDDYECRRGGSQRQYYRVSIEQTDRARSAATQAANSIVIRASGCAIVFATNQDITRTLVYEQVGPDTTIELLDAAEVVIHQYLDQDYQTAFQPLEARGVQWPFSVMLYGSDEANVDPPAGRGLRVYDDLRELATDPDLPYVAVCNADGDRIYAKLRVTPARRREPAQYYTADIIATEVTATPASASRTSS